jgi:hypothetical protein
LQEIGNSGCGRMELRKRKRKGIVYVQMPVWMPVWMPVAFVEIKREKENMHDLLRNHSRIEEEGKEKDCCDD